MNKIMCKAIAQRILKDRGISNKNSIGATEQLFSNECQTLDVQ